MSQKVRILTSQIELSNVTKTNFFNVAKSEVFNVAKTNYLNATKSEVFNVI